MNKNHTFLDSLSVSCIKKRGVFDETLIKLPGYTTLFPQSWTSTGVARVIVYVKNSLHFEQIEDLQDDQVQSIWLRAGFRGSQQIYFCHFYREHSNSSGSTMAAQRSSLDKFLSQWENASEYRKKDTVNEVHIVGDMNLDALNGEVVCYIISSVIPSRNCP